MSLLIKSKKNWRNRLQATCSSGLLEAYCHQVETCTRIALNCMEGDSQNRPNIVKITDKLNEIETDTFKLPLKDMGKEPKDIPGGHPNIKLGTDLIGCSDLEVIDAREPSLDVVEELIVGRTEEKEKIMVLLKDMSEKIVILPVYGIGGIGKTTFARMIYNDPNFNGYARVWVHVSQRFNLHKILDSIHLELPEKESQVDERHMIHSCLTKLPHDKKIMIVLDDLWEDDQFQLQELKDKIYRDNNNIIILVTTRSERVAERIYTNIQPYKILPLTSDMCWDIIKQRSGFEDRDVKEQLMDIGQEIAQKCGGVALAAQSLDFTLRSMKNFDQWMKVKDSNIWNESVSKDFSLPNHVLASLKLSYSYMSLCLKQCFSYCAMFPKGHKIVKNDLIYQWISLDFIKPTKLLSSMEICEKYILQLLGLSFFQQSVSPKTSELYYGQATSFTMHDLVHDLAISLLGSRILYQSEQGNTVGSSCEYALLSDCRKPLELCLTSPERLIALRFLDSSRCKLIIGAAFAPARSLRVLDLNECSIQKFPYSIGQLKQLRYLNAPRIQDRMVPGCISNLSNLVYLNLQNSLSIERLPESIGEMGSLMHLDLSACSSILRLPVSLINLEKLMHLDLSNCFGISGLSDSLWSLSRLEYLNLSNCKSIEYLTGAMAGLTELQCLNLSRVSCFGLQQVLVNLTKLRYLNLYGCQDDGIVDEAGSDGLLGCISSLSNLEYLNLGYNGKLCTIPETIGNLTKLNTLDLSLCYNLQRLPASLSAMNSLKFLHVSGCYKLDKSTLPQNNNSSSLLPHFVVHAGDGDSSSNLSELEDKQPTLLEVSRLENVKSAEEVKRIKLAEKQSIGKLELAWTRDAKRFVDDREVLRRLVPPDTLARLTLKGYNGISFPSWMMSVATYLPHLEEVAMYDLPSCNVLPPLGQLPNLRQLKIGGMDSIRSIYGEFYSGRRAFPRLERFSLSRMECLEEWAAYCIGEDGLNELVFPELYQISIDRCPLLRFKACPPPCKQDLFISRSDKVLLSSWENSGHVSASSSAATRRLLVSCCKAPLHQWSLLRHLPCLTEMQIINCGDLTCSSTDLLQCLSSLETLTVAGRYRKNNILAPALPERLGDLSSLRELNILSCKSIKALPDSMRRLSCLQSLRIDGCPELVQWCESDENEMKIAHIEEKILNCNPLRVIRRQIAKWMRQN